eukprot:gene6770-12336_t
MDCKRKVAMILTVLDLVDDEDEGAKRSRGKTRQWVKRREERGLFENIVTELTVEDSAAYREMMRMKHEDFLVILNFIEKDITPHQIIGDDAFALKPTVMKPYPQAGLDEAKRIYNYRHSRARRISENLFGIIANRWRVFRSVILLPPTTIEYLTMATLTIHNFLRQSDSKGTYCPSNLTDNVGRDGETILGHWQSGNPGESMLPLAVPSTGHNASMNAKEVRDCLKDFFCNEGAVEWQWEK